MKKLFPLILGALLCSPAQAVTVNIQMWIPAYCMYATGSIYATAEGGTEPYTYSWNTGSTDPSLYDLVAGTYSVTVTDANSDQATANITLTSYPFEAAVEGMVGCPDDMIGPPFRMIGQSYIYVTGVPPLTLDGNYLADVITGGPGGLAALYVSNFNVWPVAGTQLSIPFTDSNGCPGTHRRRDPSAAGIPRCASAHYGTCMRWRQQWHCHGAGRFGSEPRSVSHPLDQGWCAVWLPGGPVHRWPDVRPDPTHYAAAELATR
ncbi:MAG: SprB repeat-containing protein [Flavobacteriales bacterium]|nr:SprB repeat-containing protein [Flavobacteriales bacterium]